jgi:hypothetical protein
MIDGYENLVLENGDYMDLEWEIDGHANPEWVIDECKDLELMLDDYANLEKMDSDHVEIVLNLLFCSYLNIKTHAYFMKLNLVTFLNDVQYI